MAGVECNWFWVDGDTQEFLRITQGISNPTKPNQLKTARKSLKCIESNWEISR